MWTKWTLWTLYHAYNGIADFKGGALHLAYAEINKFDKLNDQRPYISHTT